MRNPIENEEVVGEVSVIGDTSIDEIKEVTKASILDAFYKDESVLTKVFFILAGKKTDFSALVQNLEQGRSEFKKLDTASNDEDYQKVA